MQSILARKVGIILCVLLAVLAFFDFRLGQRGKWLPKNLPVEFGPWAASDLALSRYSLEVLGNPPAEGRRYTNLFNERVEAQVIAPSSFNAYLEPIIIWAGYGYALTAEKKMNIFGKAGPIRAMILQNVRDGSRIIMYYWIQNEDGTVSSRGSLRDYRDSFQRFTLGIGSIFQGRQNCIVRVFTPLHPADKEGRQARRNMNEVAQNLYEALRKQGSNGDKLAQAITNTEEKEDENTSQGADIAMLNSPLQPDIPKNQRANLLPLAMGNSWDMVSQCKRPTGTENSRDKLVIVGPKTDGDVSGIQMNINRNGKYWRREMYQQKNGITYLVAMQDESSQLMRLDTPVPLWKEPVEEGKTINWIGYFKLGKVTYASNAFSRVSAYEVHKTSAGEFKTYRIDTIVVLKRPNGEEVRFPMVRWMTPHVGYVSRGFADKGFPAFSELMRFEVK